MAFKIKDGIYWTGKIDWELRKFHGEELSTYKGSSFNSYLIQDEKNVLIDFVWTPFAQEFVSNLAKQIDLKKIDYIISTHGEPDHSGALPCLMQYIPDTPIFCTQNGMKSLKGHYHKDWNFQVVKTGDRLHIGSKELIFIEAAMLHWPDTMMAYLTNDNMLFSSDVFGQHYACDFIFSDKANQYDLYYEAMKYYANIVSPYSKKCLRKIEEFQAMDLPVNMILPAHGCVWRKSPRNIIDSYKEWADSYQENQITVVYDTMYDSTRKSAEAIVKGIRNADPLTTVKIFNSAKSDKSDIITEIFRSKAVCIGSPTINGGIMSSIAALLEELRTLNFSGKKAAAFGSYGWSPASTRIIGEKLKEAGFEMMNEGLKINWQPDDASIEACMDFGAGFAIDTKYEVPVMA